MTTLTFGRNLRTHRQRLGLTQKNLCVRIGRVSGRPSKAGITQSFLSQLEAEIALPSLRMALAISRAIGVSLDELCKEA